MIIDKEGITQLILDKKITINSPIVFFDLETTGTDALTDKIVEIGVVKVMPDGRALTHSKYVNPEIPIPKDSTAIHGITDEDVQGAVTFKDMAPKLYSFFEGCNIAGYNSDKFDVTFLAEQFAQVGYDFPSGDTKLIDILKIERFINGHKLSDVYEHRTGKPMENAHAALDDTLATIEILAAQLEHPTLAGVDLEDVPELYSDGGDKEFVDFPFNKIYKKDGELFLDVGQHKDKPLCEVDKGYIDWMLSNTKAPFPSKTKICITNYNKEKAGLANKVFDV